METFQGDGMDDTAEACAPIKGQETELKLEPNLDSRWRAPSIWWPLMWGVMFLLCALAIEHVDWVFVDVGNSVGAASPSHSSSIFNVATVVLIVSELGYAFIIAWVVSYFIEAGSKREQNDLFKDSMSAISRETFSGVFRIRHETGYVRAVIANCLETRLLREGYDITYTVDPFTPAQEASKKLDPGRFVQLTANIRYRARNVGPKRETFQTTYGIPLRSGNLRALSKLSLIKVGTREYRGADLEKLRMADAAPGHSPDEALYSFEFDLDPYDSVEVSIDLTLVKERSDSEPFGFGLPTMDAIIRMNMNVPDVIFGCTPRIIGKLREVRSPENGRAGEWKIDHPILPYNGVVLWWRTRDDDGSAAITANSVDETPPPKNRRQMKTNIQTKLKPSRRSRKSTSQTGAIVANPPAPEKAS